MRGRLQWSASPTGVQTPVRHVPPKRKKHSQGIVIPDKQREVARIRSMAKNVSPEALRLFARLFVNRDLREFVRVFEEPAAIPLIPGRYAYTVIKNGDRRVAVLHQQRGEVSEEIARGGTAAVFIYAARYHLGACRAIMQAISSARSAGHNWYIKDGFDEGNLWDALCVYRMARSAAEGLNKVTKINQLRFIDQDHVMMKFQGCDMGVGPPYERILHVGSGMMGGTLFSSPEGTTCVDPLNMPGGTLDYYHRDLEGIALDDYDTIYSDAAIGDVTGLKTSRAVALLHAQLAERNRHGVRVYLKLNAADDVGPPGAMIRKPRPHNSEIIWEVDHAAAGYQDQIGQIRSDITAANEKRMEDLFNQTPHHEIKDVKPSEELLGTFLWRGVMLPTPALAPTHQPTDAFLSKLSRIPSDKAANRQSLWAKRLWETEFEDYLSIIADYNLGIAQYAIIPRSHMRTGLALFMDPLIGHVQLSINSLFISARICGWSCYKTPSGWRISPMEIHANA